MNKILINFAHPAKARSKMNKALLAAVKGLEGVTINELYANYPDFLINVKREQYLCETHDVIIFQHPIYWYSTPAIMKEWLNLVLAHGRAYGLDGDITRLDLLEAAGAAEAELLIITIGDFEKSRELVELAAKHYPHLKIAANASDRWAGYDLMDLGVTHIRRETFGSAMALGQDALQLLGVDPYKAHRLMLIFRKTDKQMMPELYKIHQEDEDRYRSMYQKHTADLEELMTLDLNADMEALDKAC